MDDLGVAPVSPVFHHGEAPNPPSEENLSCVGQLLQAFTGRSVVLGHGSGGKKSQFCPVEMGILSKEAGLSNEDV